MKKITLALDLKDDPILIEAYKKYHENVWPEIEDAIQNSGIDKMEIYCIGNRLFMIVEANDDFSFEKKLEMDGGNPKNQKWEELMWNYQQALPFAQPGEKWIQMEKVYEFNSK